MGLEWIALCIAVLKAHIGWWLTGALIPTRFIHPTDLGSPFLLKLLYTEPSTPAREVKLIFEKKPIYVIPAQIKRNRSSSESDFDIGLDKELETHYTLENNIDGTGIYRRNSDF